MSLEDWLGRPGLASGLGCQIHVRLPGGRRMTFASDRRTLVVGRGAAADVRIQHPAVGARHLVVHHRDEGFAVTDQGAPGGTRASGRRLEPHATLPLADGEVVEIGPLELTFEEVVEAIVVDEAPEDSLDDALRGAGPPAAEVNGARAVRSSLCTLRPELLRRPPGQPRDTVEPRAANAGGGGWVGAPASLRPPPRCRPAARHVGNRLAVHWPLLLQVVAAVAVFTALALLVVIVLL